MHFSYWTIKTHKLRYKDLIEKVDELYLSDRAKQKIWEKDKSQEFQDWKELTFDTTVNDKKILSDTTGMNLAFTYFQNLSVKDGDTLFQDSFTVQKSYIGNFVKFYVKSTVIRTIRGEKIRYAPSIITEPIAHYSAFFEKNWEFIKKAYPDIIYLPFAFLERIPENSSNYLILQNCNFYQLIFGYEGNILGRGNIVGSKWHVRA